MLRMHALALAMEKHEGGYQPLDPALDSKQVPLGNAGRDEEPRLFNLNQSRSLESVDGVYKSSEETSNDHSNHGAPEQELRPALPPRQGPRSATLPARLGSGQAGSNKNQYLPTSQYSSQPLPAYQLQYFPTTVPVTEPQQYYPSPPPLAQQRQDSGYGSMYSTSRHGTPPQTYYPPPDLISRHSSIPQTHQHASIARKPVPYHPGQPTSYTQQVPMGQGHRGSESSLYPMTPPPPYYPPHQAIR